MDTVLDSLNVCNKDQEFYSTRNNMDNLCNPFTLGLQRKKNGFGYDCGLNCWSRRIVISDIVNTCSLVEGTMMTRTKTGILVVLYLE